MAKPRKSSPKGKSKKRDASGAGKKDKIASSRPKKTSKAGGKAKPKKHAKPALSKPKQLGGVKPIGMLAADDDPLGACYYVDNFGQNVCEETTKSQCASISGSKFIAGGRCI